MPCVGNSTFYCRKTLCPTFSWCFWGGNNPLSSREDIRSTVFQSCVFTAMKANVFIVENVCVSAQWMWRSIRNPANEREGRSAYSVMNVRRFVRPKYCIKKWSWRYSCNGKVEFFTYTWKIKDIFIIFLCCYSLRSVFIWHFIYGSRRIINYRKDGVCCFFRHCFW